VARTKIYAIVRRQILEKETDFYPFSVEQSSFDKVIEGASDAEFF
jgi:hypothetical protein